MVFTRRARWRGRPRPSASRVPFGRPRADVASGCTRRIRRPTGACRSRVAALTAAADDEHRRVHVRRRQERAPRQREAGGQAEPSLGTGSVLAHYGPLQHEVGRDQPAAGRQQRPQQAGRDPVRRVGHHPERPAGQPDRGGVRVHHGDAGEPLAQDAGPPRVQLDRDHPRPRPHQVRGQGPFAGPDVEHELAGPYPGGGDHPRRPFVSEPVPAPCPARPPGGGHDGPSPCRYPRADRSPPRPRPSIRFPGTARRLAVPNMPHSRQCSDRASQTAEGHVVGSMIRLGTLVILPAVSRSWSVPCVRRLPPTSPDDMSSRHARQVARCHLIATRSSASSAPHRRPGNPY